jgi:hypothetical protein
MMNISKSKKKFNKTPIRPIKIYWQKSKKDEKTNKYFGQNFIKPEGFQINIKLKKYAFFKIFIMFWVR